MLHTAAHVFSMFCYLINSLCLTEITFMQASKLVKMGTSKINRLRR